MRGRTGGGINDNKPRWGSHDGDYRREFVDTRSVGELGGA